MNIFRSNSIKLVFLFSLITLWQQFPNNERILEKNLLSLAGVWKLSWPLGVVFAAVGENLGGFCVCAHRKEEKKSSS